MAGLLIDFLRATEGVKFQYGVCDCAQWVSLYIKYACGVDPGAQLTGDYHDEETCAALLMTNGGLLNLVSTQFAKFPDHITECDCMAYGYDVHVVGVVNYLDTQFVAIRTRSGWAMKKRGIGFHVVPFSNGGLKVLRSWRLVCPQ